MKKRMPSPFYTQFGRGGGGVPPQVACVPKCSRGAENTVGSCVQPFEHACIQHPSSAVTLLWGAWSPSTTPPSGWASGLRQVRLTRLFPSQTHLPRSLPPSCSHQVRCLCVSKLLGQIEFKSFSQKYYNSHGKVGHSCIPEYGGAVAHQPLDTLPQLPPGQDALLSLALKTLSELTLSAFLSLPSER